MADDARDMQARIDSLSSTLEGLADDYVNLPNFGDARFRGGSKILFTEALHLWRNDWLSREQVESKARDATRKWVEIELDFGDTEIVTDKPSGDSATSTTADVVKATRKYLDRLDDRGIKWTFYEAIAWSELFGGALLVLGLDDGGDVKQPLNEGALRGIRWAFVAECQNALVYSYENDRNAGASYGKPKTYLVSNTATREIFEIHASRVLRFDGPLTPRDSQIENGGWQDSALQPTREAIRDYHAGQAGATNALRKFSIDKFRQKGLADLVMQPGGAEKLRLRMRAIRSGMQLAGVVPIDADLEDYEVTGRQVSGLGDLIDRKRQNVAGAINVPEAKIFGQAQGTVRAGAESDDKTYDADVTALQEQRIVPQMTRLVYLALASLDGPTGGALPDEIKIVPCPLAEPSAKEKAEVFKLRMEALKIAIVDAGLLEVHEARESEFADGAHGVKLDPDVDDAIAELDEIEREAAAETARNPPPPVVPPVPGKAAPTDAAPGAVPVKPEPTSVPKGGSPRSGV